MSWQKEEVNKKKIATFDRFHSYAIHCEIRYV